MSRLESWAVGYGDNNHFRAPELRPKVVRGRVYDDSRYPDGTVITTSAVCAASGREITTESGRRYLLGEPEAQWLTFLAEHGIAFDHDNPIRIR